MPDNLGKTGKQDDTRINVNQPHEVVYWTDKFGISKETLLEAVKAAGVMVADVRAWLKKKGHIV